MFNSRLRIGFFAIAYLIPCGGCEQSGPLEGPVAIYGGTAPKHGMLCASFSDRSDILSVHETVTDGPASKAGILVGDEVLEINHTKFKTADQVLSFLRTTKPGDQVVVLIRRSEMEIEFNITLCDFKTFVTLRKLEGQPRSGEQIFDDRSKAEP